MKVIIAGGGTGGHLYPGIAVAEEFEKRKAGDREINKNEIVFVGTEYGLEARVIPKEGYPIRFLRAQGFVGKSFLKRINALFSLFLSIMDSVRIIRDVKPDIVIGVGGYASVGMVLSAYLKGIPTIILEQNSVPGLANRILGKFADAIAVTYEESINFFPTFRTFLTGNPVRKKMISIDANTYSSAYSLFPVEKDRFTVFIFGGSLGASSINKKTEEALNYLLDLKQDIQFIHQTGQKDYELVKNAYRSTGFNAVVAPFIYQMAEAYSISDIVVCRAGATTLSEITAMGKASILIPYPYAASDHQQKNAAKLEEIGASILISEKELNGMILADAIRELFNNKELRQEMQRAASSFSRAEASETIVDLAMSLVKKNKKINHG